MIAIRQQDLCCNERNSALLLSLTLLVLATPALAQTKAEYCSPGGTACEYLADNGFSASSSPWTYSSGSGRSWVSSPCDASLTWAAYLEPGDQVRQNHTTDQFPFWYVRLDLYKTSDNVTANDTFTVTVASYTTWEVHTVRASDYAGLCGLVDIPLDINWGNQYISVAIKRKASSTTTMYIDNVHLIGSIY